MYTGIIKTTARVKEISDHNQVVDLILEDKGLAEGSAVDESINIDGVCLTVVEVIGSDALRFQMMPETMRVTRMGELKVGDEVNIEKSMSAGDQIGGHFVMGHSDGTGTVSEIRNEGDSRVLRIDTPQELLKFIPLKGSISVNGASLTVSAATDEAFEVSLIPHTLKITNLSDLEVGDTVNLEVDMMARYIAKLQEKH